MAACLAMLSDALVCALRHDSQHPSNDTTATLKSHELANGVVLGYQALTRSSAVAINTDLSDTTATISRWTNHPVAVKNTQHAFEERGRKVSASLVPIYLRKPCHGSAQPVPATGNPSPRILRLRDMNILNQLTTGRAYYV